MNYHTVLSAKSIKTLDRLDQKTGSRILARFKELAANPSDPRISSQVETAPGKRYSRVGDWRIVFEIEEATKTIYIITIQHRSRVYKEVKKRD